MAEYIEREALIADLELLAKYQNGERQQGILGVCTTIRNRPTADVVEVDKVAEMLRRSFGDDCACNFNGNDEWMWEKCKYAENDCPYPKEDNGCWKEFVKHFIAKMDGKGEGE